MKVDDLKKLIKEAVNEALEEKRKTDAAVETIDEDEDEDEDMEWGGPLPREILEALASEIEAKKISADVVFLNNAPITSPWLSHDDSVRQHGKSDYDRRVSDYYDTIEKYAEVPFPRSKSEYLTGRIGSSAALDIRLDPALDKAKLAKVMDTIARSARSIMKGKGCKEFEVTKPKGEIGGVLVDATYGWDDPLAISTAIGVLENSKKSKVLRIWSYWFRPV